MAAIARENEAKAAQLPELNDQFGEQGSWEVESHVPKTYRGTDEGLRIESAFTDNWESWQQVIVALGDEYRERLKKDE